MKETNQIVRALSAAILCAVLVLNGTAQQTKPAARPQPQEPAKPSGVSTGGVYAPVKDALNRPITAGGFVENAPVVFSDIIEAAGLGKYQNHSGQNPKKYILGEVATGGVALFDYDNDGWLDIYFVNGSTEKAYAGLEPPPHSALFHNNHDGTFTDVTSKAGVDNGRWGMGVTIGDFDNDGYDDIYIANYGKNRLYHNNHDGTFTDVAEQAGVALNVWSTAPAFADYDHDGFLDLFVAGYVKFDLSNPPLPGSPVVGYNFCQFRGQVVMCGPRGLKGERDFLFHNNGDGTFTEVAQKAGVSDPEGYYGLASAWVDVNDDGWVDLVVANDSTPNFLYLNKKDGTFEDVSLASGFALNENGREQASMGIAVGDYNGDGRVDLYVTNFSDDYNTLYRNEGDANFTDITLQAGLGEPTIPFLGWGTGFIDYDNDGRLDIFVANGHVYPEVENYDWGTTWKQRPLLFRNVNGARFEEVPAREHSGLGRTYSARGAAFGSIFNDGRIDVVLNNVDSQPALLRNNVTGNNWLLVKLVGGPKSQRNAIGATAFLTAGGVRQRRDVVGGGSYSSQSDYRLHFGLGQWKEVEKLEIRWPSGLRETLKVPGVNRILTIVEGKGITAETVVKPEKKK